MTRLAHDWFPVDLPEQVTVGERSWLYSAYALHHCRGRVEIGSDCGLYSGTHFELGPRGRVRIGPYCTIVGAIFAVNGDVEIGDHTFIAHEVVIADTPFALPPAQAQGTQSPPIRIGSGAWIGARAILLAGADIGEDAIIGAGAVVAGPVPSGATAAGNPARVVPSGSSAPNPARIAGR